MSLREIECVYRALLPPNTAADAFSCQVLVYTLWAISKFICMCVRLGSKPTCVSLDGTWLSLVTKCYERKKYSIFWIYFSAPVKAFSGHGSENKFYQSASFYERWVSTWTLLSAKVSTVLVILHERFLHQSAGWTFLTSSHQFEEMKQINWEFWQF